MKKIFFSILACGMIATMASCQNEGEPQMPGNNGVIAADFPEGAVPTQVSVGIDADAKTRAGANDLPLWDAFTAINTGDISGLPMQYGIYYPDGRLYYSTTTPTMCAPGGSTITVPMPANQTKMKIFIWADKTAKGDVYTLDWEKKSVSLNTNPARNRELFATFAGRGDAFYYWGDVNVKSPSTIKLKRPFVQINVLTDELGKGQLEHDYPEGIFTGFGLVETINGSMAYIPTTWYWESDTFDMSMYNMVEEKLPNWTSGPAKTGSLNGVEKRYIGVFYVLAPRTRKAWKDEKSGTILDGFILNVYNDQKTDGTAIISIGNELPSQLKANERLIIHNANSGSGGEPGSGILTSETNINVSVDGSYDDNGTEVTF